MQQETKVEKKAEKVAEKPLVELDGPGMRRLVAAGLGGVVRPTRLAAPSEFFSIARGEEADSVVQRSRIF